MSIQRSLNSGFRLRSVSSCRWIAVRPITPATRSLPCTQTRWPTGMALSCPPMA